MLMCRPHMRSAPELNLLGEHWHEMAKAASSELAGSEFSTVSTRAVPPSASTEKSATCGHGSRSAHLWASERQGRVRE